MAAGRDPRQARFLTRASLRWVLRNRAWTPYFLIRYWRFARWRMANPHIIAEGFVFLGKGARLTARRGMARMIVGKWVHLNDDARIYAHEGCLRIGDKAVLGRGATVTSYLDIEVGEASLIGDWVYVTDFDHVFADVLRPIKDQGLARSPVRIGPDVWLGTKVTVVRGVEIGQGAVVAANAVVSRDLPAWSVSVGVPARVIRDRREDYAAQQAHRDAIADMARKVREAGRSLPTPPSRPDP